MNSQAEHKITLDHRMLQAKVYIRQSTMIQVEENVESKRRQYALAKRAQELGWPANRVEVIDDDLAQSGASSKGRNGFQRLMSEVGLGQVGAVFCLEVSRVARSSADWHRLLEMCAWTGTLVIDEDGIYDPQDFNDRLLLGIKGVISEAELHLIRQRLQGGARSKAQRGELPVRLPVGLVYNKAGTVNFDPDVQVQETIHLVFNTYNQVQSGQAVVRYFRDHNLLFPMRLHCGPNKGDLEWSPITFSRVFSLLHNPAYAGVYVYGRRSLSRTGHLRVVPLEEWPIVVQDVYPAYISWEQFLKNLERLRDNSYRPDSNHRGAPREGKALLQGIVICGKCGRRMGIEYSRKDNPSYRCRQAYHQYTARECQSMVGSAVDDAVARLLLEALQPAQIALSLSVFDHAAEHQLQIEKQWEQTITRARYEAELARRRYREVDPSNRLVAITLETEWNQKLTEVERLEQEYVQVQARLLEALSPEERQQIHELVEHLPRIWNADTTTHAHRKQLLRFLIKDVTLTRQPDGIHIDVRWNTEQLTSLIIPPSPSAVVLAKTDPEVINYIRQLSVDHTDHQIACRLNEEGYHPKREKAFSQRSIRRLRSAYQIPLQCPSRPVIVNNQPRGDGRYSARTLADFFQVDVSTIHKWRSKGILQGIQDNRGAAWWFDVTPEKLAELQSRKLTDTKHSKDLQNPSDRRK